MCGGDLNHLLKATSRHPRTVANIGESDAVGVPIGVQDSQSRDEHETDAGETQAPSMWAQILS
jgi:hypothetical protein